MLNETLKYIRGIISTNWSIVLYTLIFFLIVYFSFGIYFERYEILFNALASGKLTPGTKYNDFFYLAHILLIKVYSFLANYLNNYNWLGIFQTGYILASFYFILKRFKAISNKPLYLSIILFTVSVFFVEQIMLQVYTRISFMLSLASLLFFFNLDKNKPHYYLQYFVGYIMFLVASLTRVEIALLTFLIISMYNIILMNEKPFIKKIGETTLKIIPLFIPITIIFGWTFYEINNSTEFYKQIEPDVEYELTGRDNIVPIANMKSKIDSLRYLAIDKVVWGDASTNDANFLRSLIRSKSITDSTSVLLTKAIKSIIESSKDQVVLIISVHVILMLLLFQFYLNKLNKIFLILVFHIAFLFTILALSYRIKMTETAISSLFFVVLILYLLLLYKDLSLKNTFGKICILILTVLTVFQINSTINKSNNLKYRTQFFEESLKIIKTNFAEKNILLNGESIKLLYAFTPFSTYNFSPPLKNIIIYDSQHLSSVEPYKTFLAKDCNCDPNHYGEYFSYLKTNKNENVFLMSEDFKEFLEEYLVVVHNLDIKFINSEIETYNTNFNNFYEKEINAYYIN